MKDKTWVLLMASFVILCSAVLAAKAPEQDALDRARENLAQRSYDEAISALNSAIQINPNSAEAYYQLGRANSAKGDLDQAILDYTKAIELNSPDIVQSAYNNRGITYEKKGEYEKALDDYTKGIEAMANPWFSGFQTNKAQLHRNRAGIYVQKGDYDKAWEDVHSVEKLGYEVEPEFLGALKNASGREK